MADASDMFLDPIRAYERDGTQPRFLSKGVTGAWQRPIPGPSLHEATAARQMKSGDLPADLGSLYMPQRGVIAPEIAPCRSMRGDSEQERLFDEEMARQAAADEVRDLDETRGYLRATMALGRDAIDELARRIRSGDESALEATQREAKEREAKERAPQAPSPQTPAELREHAKELAAASEAIVERAEKRESAPRGAKLGKLANNELIRLVTGGKTAAVALSKAAPMRTAAVRKLCEAHKLANRKQEFLENRAHAVVMGAFLELERAFIDLGFGAWMPFRHCDQWLMFTSAMRKVLAANGLISPQGPNHWKKFLSETPEVPREQEWPQAKPEMFKSWSLLERNKAMTIEDLLIEKRTHHTPWRARPPDA